MSGREADLDGRAVPGKLTVLEDDSLLGLIEHRRQLEIGGELTVDRCDRALKSPSLLRIGFAEPAHRPMLP
jgi:hypothetical protein